MSERSEFSKFQISECISQLEITKRNLKANYSFGFGLQNET
ncbi:hypothetical protein EAL2_c01130 [Peptoclostridium acidaminophilum DSM 3953]|uniref:Uncharacterized protein n=1 Tax=Peptoclostridium acidaminophilum DSM 3953 TaxID=1286171 RepID=W8TGX2_PEPAC|nr:hypothetical protein EAL2_c01130 [Peptoclostridium acidaminophilum DSM 3953]